MLGMLGNRGLDATINFFHIKVIHIAHKAAVLSIISQYTPAPPKLVASPQKLIVVPDNAANVEPAITKVH